MCTVLYHCEYLMVGVGLLVGIIASHFQLSHRLLDMDSIYDEI